MLERFLTDTLTNAVVLDDVRVLSTSVSKRLQDGRPLRALLHEKTHHASFDSPVGLALAALMAGSALRTSNVDPETFTLRQRDCLLIRQVSTLFEPLIEGLALFAEFDAVPGDAKVASAVSAAATYLMFGAVAYDSLRDLIWQHRLQDMSQREAKRDLLLQPLQQRPRYLLGYLAVKQMYYQLEKRCRRLVDSDLFVLLMLDYWFRDRPLAQRLLRLDRNNPQAVFEDLVWIVNRFEERFEELVLHVDEYVTELVEWQLTASSEPSPIGMGDGPAYRGPKAPSLDLEATFRFGELTYGMNFGILKYRTDFRFSSTELAIEVSQNRTARMLTAAGELAGEGIPVVQNASVGSYPGSMEGVLTPALGRRAVMAITSADGIVAVRNWGTTNWNPPELVNYFDHLPSALEIQRIKRVVVENQAKTRKLPLVRKYEEPLDDVTQQAIDHLYPKIIGLPPSDRANFMKALSEKGLAGPLQSESLMSTLSRASARAGCHIWQFEADAKDNDWDANALIAEMNEINRRLEPILGQPALRINNGIVASVV